MKHSPILTLTAAILCLVTADVSSLETPIVFTQVPVTQPSSVGSDRVPCPDGSRLVVLSPDQSLEVITSGFSSACDPAVSYDGRTILFAGKIDPEDRFNIFEFSLDGTPTRQLTRELGDCREPLYLPKASVSAPLFEDPVRWMVFTSTAEGALDELGRGEATSLYVMNLDPITGRDTVLWRTTYNLGGDFSPTVLQDGRVLFSSHQADRVKLMTVTWAGDNLNLFRNADGDTIQSMACQLQGERSVVLVESRSPDRGGQLVKISLKRPLHLREVLTGPGGRYTTPHAMNGGGLLVAHQREDGDFAIVLFDRDAGRAGPVVFDDPDYDDFDAIEVAPHPEPLARIPMLEFASVLDIEGFDDAGQLHCMSVYDSDNEAIRRLEPGSVKWARFIQGVPLSTEYQERCRATSGDPSWPPPCVETRILGEAPVEPDGSFFVNITGNIPFYIELLDDEKKTLHSMESWIWIRSKSQRGCIGCHENKELSPQNRATDALLKMQPTFIGTDSEKTTQPLQEPLPVDMKSSHDVRESKGQP